MKETFYFTVSPFALYDTIKALKNDNIYIHQTLHVTKEDSSLMIIVSQEWIPQSTGFKECLPDKDEVDK